MPHPNIHVDLTLNKRVNSRTYHENYNDFLSLHAGKKNKKQMNNHLDETIADFLQKK